MKKFSKTLLKWYTINRRDFLWRETKEPYNIWLSEIILQQTKTEQGIPYYEKFIKKYPTIKELALADEQEVLKIWQGLGYYSRARNLHHTAKHIAFNLNGVFPRTYKDLINLKGIGDYTASAIASICFNQKEAVLDGNVFRVLARYFGIYSDISSGNGKKEFKTLALKLLPEDNFSDYNQSLMDFGAIQCTPKKTNCNTCPLNESCFANLNNEVDRLPVKKKKNNIKKRYFNYIVYLDVNNNTLIYKREQKDIWQNLYEFFLIETPKKTNEKIILNRINQSKTVKITKQELSKYNTTQTIHKLSHQHIYTTFWIVKLNDTLTDSISFKELKSFPVATLTDNFIESFTNS